MTFIESENFRERFYYTVFYCLSWGLLLLNDGIYWDDWTVLNVSGDAILCQFVQNGYVLNAYMMRFLFGLTQNMFLFRAYTFIAYLLIIYIYDDILSSIKQITKLDRFLIVMIFAVLPLNYARISVAMMFVFNTSFLFFMIAFWILAKYFYRRALLLRVVSLLLFAMSFFTPSIILFYTTALLYIAYKERATIKNIPSFLAMALKYIDFILIPIVFSILRAVYFSPRGLYEGYNIIKLSGIIRAPFDTLIYGKIFFSELISILVNTFLSNYIELTFIGFALFLIIFTFLKNSARGDYSKTDIALFAGGALIFIVALFPYSVVNKHPYFDDWTTRYQLLLGIPTSIIIYYAIKIFFLNLIANWKCVIFSIAIFVVMSIHANVYTLLQYQKDTFKEDAIMQHFRSSGIVRDSTSFYIVDDAQQLNAMKRTYRLYEYAGMFKKIYGDEIRFASRDPNDWKEYPLIMRYAECGIFTMRDYKIKPAQYKVTINVGDYNLSSTINTLKLLAWRFVDRAKYERLLNGVVNVSYERI